MHMNTQDIIQIVLYVAMLTALTPLLGCYMARVFGGERHFLSGMLGWLERFVYKIAGVNASAEMNWQSYTGALIEFNVVGLLVLIVMQLTQQFLPLNPQQLPATSWHLAFNTAVSFVTNTNWQSYAGEVTLSYFTQMIGLAVQNFVSAATGLAVLLALIRGLSRKNASTIGNFWADMVRSTIYVLLPLCVLFSIVLVGEGVVQTFDSYAITTTIEGESQTIPLGPAASQIAIKQLGTNGGGYFNANSAHPLENPTPLSNFLQMLALLLIPAALTAMYGRMVGSIRHGWILFGVMLFLFLAGLGASLWSEYSLNPTLQIAQNMEGKEVRFGITNSVLWSVATTDASNGSVNAMHSSLTPLAGGIALFNLMLGEIIFGGVGAGLYGMIVFVLLTVFLAGLMVGRTPEYLGKKIERREVQMVVLSILAPCATILLMSAISAVLPAGLSSLANPGPHGLSEILYAFSSAAGNNGSAFAGLNANTPYYNVMLGVAMLIGRYAIIVPVLSIAGSMASKTTSTPSTGTFSTNGGLFASLLVGVILIVGALTFLPALTLGPIVEQLLMNAGRGF